MPRGKAGGAQAQNGRKRPGPPLDPDLNVSSSSGSSSPVPTPRRLNRRAERVVLQIQTRLNPGSRSLGPLYPINSNSLILYEAAEDGFHLTENPNGLVPVVVNPHFTDPRPEVDFYGLKEVQKEGIRFMWNSFAREGQGCILGHGMGLGKTLSALTLMMALLEQREGCRGRIEAEQRALAKILVLTPKSILSVWEKQISEWSPQNKKLDYVVVTSGMRRATAEEHIRKFETDRKEVLLLSYDSFKKYRNLFRDYEHPLKLGICDEAHYLKNAKAQRTLALGPYELDDGSGRRPTIETLIGLTGTPYQNSEEELCNLVNLFRPNCLPANTQQLLKELRSADNAKNTKRTDAEKQEAKERAHELRQQLHPDFKPVIHYRSGRVKDVDKHELIVCVKLEEQPQHRMYEALTNYPEFQELNFYTKLDILTKLCIHPEYAFISQIVKQPSLGAVATQFRSAIEEEPGTVNFADAGKLNFVVQLLSHIFRQNDAKDEKVVVVSYFVEHLDRLRKACDYFVENAEPPVPEFKCIMYTGTDSESARKNILDRFRSNGEGIRILLLSSEAGGQGLDLTAANHLILMDPGWNPAIDSQIVARVYRERQKKHCFVYRLLATNTIDEVMFLNQLTKTEIDQYYKGEEPELEPQSGYDPKDLTKYHHAAGSLTLDMLEKINASGAAADEDDSFERRAFAGDLAKCKRYTSATAVPPVLGSLKATWEHGVTFAFHKFQADDGSDIYQTLEEILEVSDTEDEN